MRESTEEWSDGERERFCWHQNLEVN